MNFSRLNTHDRKRASLVYLKIIYMKYPLLRKYINNIIKLVRQNNAPKSSINGIIIQHIGRTEAYKILLISITAVINCALQERICHDNRKDHSICYGCLSFCAQCNCPLCGELKFCAGCFDYGYCLNCGT